MTIELCQDCYKKTTNVILRRNYDFKDLLCTNCRTSLSRTCECCNRKYLLHIDDICSNCAGNWNTIFKPWRKFVFSSRLKLYGLVAKAQLNHKSFPLRGRLKKSFYPSKTRGKTCGFPQKNDERRWTKMSEIQTICMMCKRPLTAIEEYLDLAVCQPCNRAYWGDPLKGRKRR